MKKKNKTRYSKSDLSLAKSSVAGGECFAWDIGYISFDFPADAVGTVTPYLLMQTIIPALQKCEHKKWKKIKNNPKHCYVDMTSPRASGALAWLQSANMSKTLQSFGINETIVKEIFAFHIGGDKRLFGIRDRAIFRILWYDENPTAYSLNCNSALARKQFGNKYFEWDMSELDHDFPDNAREHLTAEHLTKSILTKLKQHEDKKWGSLHGKYHHFFNLANNPNPAAVKRLETLKLKNTARDFFSFRLTNKIRLYGYVENAVFKILWYDHEHIIYPSPKKNS